MSNQQLWQQCHSLTHHSLQAFLLSVLQKPNVYNLYQFVKHPQISSVDKKVLQLYNHFISGTYSTIPQNIRKQLSKQKIAKLKRLSILTLFEGLRQIPIRTICDQIQSTREQVIDILIEMSIVGTIQIKINQKSQTVEIHYAQIRGRPFSQQDTTLLQGKIGSILTKNKSILNIIDQSYSEIKNKHQIGFKSPTSSGHRRY